MSGKEEIQSPPEMIGQSAGLSDEAKRRTIAERMKPEAPHDLYSFEELEAAYNFERTSHRGRVFTRLVIDECKRRAAGRGERSEPVRVLDIGCGRGIELSVDYQWAIRDHVDEYWGLEPDKNIAFASGLFDRVESTVMEQAHLPDGFFDVAYSFMVMEHVDDPLRFMHALCRCLRPGGVFVFATPNRRHYFTRIAATLHAIKLDELVLRTVRRKEAEEYHYPVRYRFNDEKTIARVAHATGFAAPEFAYLEELGPRGYFPKPLRFIFHALAAKRRIIKQRNALITLVGRIAKPG